MSGRTVGSLETWQPDDKSFNKHVLQEGRGDVTPNEGSVCIVFVTVVGDLEISDADLGCYRLNMDTEVTVGEGDTRLSDLLDKVVMSMKEGERCYINCKVDVKGERISELDVASTNPKFNVMLHSFSRAADPDELEGDELLERAEHHKESGVLLYSAGNMEFAMRRFQRALDYVKKIKDSGNPPKSVLDRARIITCQCELNIAACRLKTNEFEQVVEHCSAALALDMENVKGLFRRAQALAKLGRYQEAKRDISFAQQLDPSNKAVLTQLRTIEELICKEKQIYRKMFSS